MHVSTPDPSLPQPFRVAVRSVLLRCIEAVDDPLEREARIQIALDAGALDYRTAYTLRCGDA